MSSSLPDPKILFYYRVASQRSWMEWKGNAKGLRVIFCTMPWRVSLLFQQLQQLQQYNERSRQFTSLVQNSLYSIGLSPATKKNWYSSSTRPSEKYTMKYNTDANVVGGSWIEGHILGHQQVSLELVCFLRAAVNAQRSQRRPNPVIQKQQQWDFRWLQMDDC